MLDNVDVMDGYLIPKRDRDPTYATFGTSYYPGNMCEKQRLTIFTML